MSLIRIQLTPAPGECAWGLSLTLLVTLSADLGCRVDNDLQIGRRKSGQSYCVILDPLLKLHDA